MNLAGVARLTESGYSTVSVPHWQLAGQSGNVKQGALRAAASATVRIPAMMKHAEPRRAAAADAEAIGLLVREAYAKYIPRMGMEPYPMTVDYAKALREQQMWVVEHDGRIIAVLGLIPRDDHLMIENIAVAATHQGGGIGRGLLAFAERQALKLGLRELRLYTAQAMHENIRLYSRFGYNETERKTVGEIPRVYMSKAISP